MQGNSLLGDTKGSPLSIREEQVVELICKGKSNKLIALGLNLTEGTVKEYLGRIFKKVGCGNRTGLAMWAIARHQLN